MLNINIIKQHFPISQLQYKFYSSTADYRSQLQSAVLCRSFFYIKYKNTTISNIGSKCVSCCAITTYAEANRLDIQNGGRDWSLTPNGLRNGTAKHRTGETDNDEKCQKGHVCKLLR